MSIQLSDVKFVIILSMENAKVLVSVTAKTVLHIYQQNKSNVFNNLTIGGKEIYHQMQNAHIAKEAVGQWNPLQV